MFKTKSILFTVIALLFPMTFAFSQTLENIPGQEASATSNDLIQYLDNLYRFGISITGILAVFMVVLGAFGYIVTSAGNTSKMLDAKEKITNALIGLAIALTAYLFLYVINPDLVKGTLQAPKDAISKITSKSTLPEGSIPCNDGGSVGTELANLCTDCPGGGKFYYKNGYALCGVDPDKKAAEDAPKEAIGCCEYDFGSFGGKKCEAGITKTVCQGKPRSPVFHLGEDYVCEGLAGIGTGDGCKKK